MPDYNTLRQAYHLPTVETFEEINPSLFQKRPDILNTVKEAYQGRVNNIDAYVGGMLESVGNPGPLFSAVIIEQFTRLRDSDRFWFENMDNG